jgi:hypothetical protein
MSSALTTTTQPFVLRWLGAITRDGRTPKIQAWISQPDPQDDRLSKELAAWPRLLPVSQLRNLSIGATCRPHAPLKGWRPAPAMRRVGGWKYFSDYVFSCGSEEGRTIVHGSNFATSLPNLNSAWLSNSMFLVQPGRLIDHLNKTVEQLTIAIPCNEVFRFFYSYSARLMEAIFDGSILALSDDKELVGACFYRGRFLNRHSARGTSTPEEIRYAYKQVRSIVWNAIRSHQQEHPSLITAQPPFQRELFIHGNASRLVLAGSPAVLITRIDDCNPD